MSRFFDEVTVSTDFRTNNPKLGLLVCEFPHLETGWKTFHLQVAISLERSNYVYTITITTSEFFNVFKISNFRTIIKHFVFTLIMNFREYILSNICYFYLFFSNDMYKFFVILLVNKHYDITKIKNFYFDNKYDYFVRFHQDLNKFSGLKSRKLRPKDKKNYRT